MKFKDFSFNLSEYGTTDTISGVNAIILAIRNILLSKPGNFPLTPDLGMNIGKYQFELLDDYTISDIRTELLTQINKFVPSVDNLLITVQKVEDIIEGKVVTGLGIAISALYDGETVDSNFLILKDKEIVSVYNETK